MVRSPRSPRPQRSFLGAHMHTHPRAMLGTWLGLPWAAGMLGRAQSSVTTTSPAMTPTSSAPSPYPYHHQEVQRISFSGRHLWGRHLWPETSQCSVHIVGWTRRPSLVSGRGLEGSSCVPGLLVPSLLRGCKGEKGAHFTEQVPSLSP